jgi:hypothetical protein
MQATLSMLSVPKATASLIVCFCVQVSAIGSLFKHVLPKLTKTEIANAVTGKNCCCLVAMRRYFFFLHRAITPTPWLPVGVDAVDIFCLQPASMLSMPLPDYRTPPQSA